MHIKSCPGNVKEYTSIDTGKAALLHKNPAPSVLWLKRGCPVILLRNMSDTLTNGSLGVVQDMDEDGPLVYFDQPGATVKN